MPIDHLIPPRDRDIGAFAVRRILPAGASRAVGPFVFLDHFGPVDLPPGRASISRSSRRDA